MVKVKVVVPVFNQLFYTKRFLQSLEKQTFKDFSVVVVNNASTDETYNWLCETYITYDGNEHGYEVTGLTNKNRYVFGRKVVGNNGLDMMIVNNYVNRGYAGGVNDGIECAQYCHEDVCVLVCNNDMEFDENCIEELLKAKDKLPDAGILGGRLLFPDGRIQHAGAFVNQFGCGQHKLAGINDADWKETDPLECEYVTGALYFITNKCLKSVGMFDERFNPAYFEELDYCVTARQKGFKTYYVPTAKAIHYENKTSVDVVGDMTKVRNLSNINQGKFYLKHDTDVYEPTSDKQALLTGKIYGDWSFSIVLRNLAKGLKRNGVDVSIAPEEYHNKIAMDDWEIQEMIKKPHDYWNRVVMRSSEGDHQYLMPASKKRLAHTTFEGTRPPQEWIRQLNHVDAVVTNSSFCKTILTERGVTSPIHIVPNPVDTDLFNPSATPLEIQGRNGFGFLFMSAFGERKNLELALRAFMLEFNKSEDVFFLVHSLSWFFVLEQMGTNVRDWIQNVVLNGQRVNNAPVIPMSQSVHPLVVPKLITSCQCAVMPSRCEGFGNLLVEAASCGIPTIATNYSGMSDFISDEVGYPLNDYKLVDMPIQPLPYFHNYIGSQWAEVSVDELRAKMRYAFEHQEETKQKGIKAREKALNYDISVVGKQLSDAMFN